MWQAQMPMNKLNFLTSTVAICVCTSASALASNEDADVKLEAYFKEYLDEHFHRQPLEATRLGDHRFDHLLDDISRQGRDGWLAHARRTLADLPKRVQYK